MTSTRCEAPNLHPAFHPWDRRQHHLGAISELARSRSANPHTAATSILRDRLIPTYLSLLPYGASSDPHPPGGDGEDPTRYSVFAQRSRETAVLDRFIAVRVGEDLRKAESALCDDSGEQANIFSSLQVSRSVCCRGFPDRARRSCLNVGRYLVPRCCSSTIVVHVPRVQFVTLTPSLDLSVIITCCRLRFTSSSRWVVMPVLVRGPHPCPYLRCSSSDLSPCRDPRP